ncbi:adhesion G protein-coupled receptor G3-like [Diadema antillarum]|uniref:adhesion G protein-coupled receptor G3-like n=1 Tax=Diadema antillarum TaxID=105358 RepID=UPI003A87785B
MTTPTQTPVATSCPRSSFVLPSGDLVTFGETAIGSTANSSFTCVLNSTTTEEHLISRLCTRTVNGEALWLQPVYASCEQLPNTQDALNRLAKENITRENAEDVSEGLVQLTTNLTDLNVEELSDVTSVLFNVTYLAAEKSEVSQNVLEVVDNILDVATSKGRVDPESSTVRSGVLSTTNALISAIQRGTSDNITYSGDNIDVAAVKVVRINFPLTAEIQRDSSSENDAIMFKANEAEEHDPEDIASVVLPDAILDFLPDNDTTLSVSIFVLHSSSLFRETPQNSSSSQQQGLEREVVSPILSVTIEGATIFNLSEPIVLRFRTLREKLSNATPYCAFWDVEALGGMWSREGCETQYLSRNKQVVCTCSHLTSFAVLLDKHGDVTSKPAHIIGQIGMYISIVCLVMTLCILLGFRKIRQKQPHQIQANLSLALLCLFVVFAVGVDRVEWGVGCIVVAALLHFFCLSSVLWMGVEAFHMYLLFVRVLRNYVPRLLLKCSLVAWGLPLIITVASVSSKWTAYDNKNYCYMMPSPSLWYGLLLPVALTLAFNFVVFVLVIYRLSCGRKMLATSMTGGSSAGEPAEILRRARNAIAIGTLVGVTWVFGFLTIGGAREFFHLLFNIFNSFQGAFIFLLFGIRQPEVQEMWRSARLRWKSEGRRKSSGFESSLMPRMSPRPSEVTELHSTLPRPSVCSSASANSNSGQKHLAVPRPY